MPISALPAQLQDMIQQGFLSRNLAEPLRARLGFRRIAERESFTAGVGESVTKTRTGLLPVVTAPIAPQQPSVLGAAPNAAAWGSEQYVLHVDQYTPPSPTALNIVTSRVGIANQFLLNARKLGEQAARSVDTLARDAIFGAYMSGNTAVTATLGAAGATVHVDDIRGFVTQINPASGIITPVSAGLPLAVTVGGDVYECVGAVADTINTSATYGGVSGTLSFASNVSVADGAAGNAVFASNAPVVIRPDGSAATGLMKPGTKLTIQALLNVKAGLEGNAVPTLDDGRYVAYVDPQQLTGLYADPTFQSFTRGAIDSEEYRMGAVSDLLGMRIVRTNLNPVQPVAGGQLRRALVCGEGALIEGVFTANGYAGAADMVDPDMVEVVDGIAHVTREPIDALKQVVTQTWSYIGGFTAPTDALTTPATIPTANNAAYKRAGIVESF